MKPSQVKKANTFQTQNLTPVKPGAPSNSAVLNLRAAPSITTKYLEQARVSSGNFNKISEPKSEPKSEPSSPKSPEFVDTSSANYNEIFLHERDRDLEEEKVFFSPLPRSKQLAVSRQNSDLDLITEPIPSSAALQALVENHDPDTKYPPDYFAPPCSPPRQTVDEPEDDESDWAYINRLQQREGFFMQPDSISVDELVILLRTGCRQVVELNKNPSGLISATSSRRGTMDGGYSSGQSQAPSFMNNGVGVYDGGIITINGTYTFRSSLLVPSGISSLERYLIQHGRANKCLRCGFYAASNSYAEHEAQALQLAAIGMRTDAGGIYVTLTCSTDPQFIRGTLRRRVIVFAPRAGVIVDEEVDLIPMVSKAVQDQTRTAKRRNVREVYPRNEPECCTMS